MKKKMKDKNELIFFVPGDIVQVRHNLDIRPKMWVVEKITRSLVNKKRQKDKKPEPP